MFDANGVPMYKYFKFRHKESAIIFELSGTVEYEDISAASKEEQKNLDNRIFYHFLWCSNGMGKSKRLPNFIILNTLREMSKDKYYRKDIIISVYNNLRMKDKLMMLK